MIRALGIVALLSSCAPNGVTLGGDYADRLARSTLTLKTLDDSVARAVSVAEGLPGLERGRLNGFAVYTDAHETFFSNGVRVGGWCSCRARVIVVGTPGDGVWARSALVHELFHAMQGCDAPLPVDDGLDADHANWHRDGLFAALESAEVGALRMGEVRSGDSGSVNP